MALPAGTRLGPYEVLRLLGAGGMGQVYRARDTRLGRDVALKILSDELAGSEAACQRFEREARAVAALAHPNIVALHDVGREGRQFFAVTELLEGETLQDLVQRGPLPLAKAIEAGAALADALAAAHAKGIVHRDVKPSNVFVTGDGRVKLLDFGLAKQRATTPRDELSQSPTQSQTEPGAVLGTLGYLSPEQARGDEADARSDIFALGCVLYEMVSGERAFARASPAETLSAVLRDEPRALRNGERFPGPLRGIVSRCLEKHPEQRFQSARDLAFALRSAAGAASSARGAAAHPRRGRGLALTAIAAVALLALVLVLGRGGARGRLVPLTATPAIESIAVLPLRNLSGDPEQEYFADGLTEALITDLAKARSLKVISGTSVLQYKNARKPLPEIARALNVQALIEGSVQRVGERVRVTAQLIDASTDRHLWAEEYDRDLRDVLSLQREIARAVVREVHVALTPQEAAGLGTARRVVPESHEAYLKGRHHVSRFTEESIVAAIGLFERAIALDPKSAEAYAGLARAHIERGIWGVVSPRETAARARVAVAQALALDEASAEAHGSLAMLHEIYDWDWAGAEREFHRALELGGGEANIHRQYSGLLHVLKRFPEAIAESDRARRLDPLSADAASSAGRIHYRARRNDRALELYKESMALDPAYLPNYARLADVYLQLGRPQEALAVLERGIAIGGETRRQNEGVAVVLAALGRRQEAQDILARFKQMAANGSDQVAYRIALIEMALGNREAAIEWLERAFRERSASLWLVNPELKFDPLRSDPRFQSLLKRMDYPPS